MATPTTNPPPWAFGTILTHVLLLPALSVCSSLCHDHPPPLPAICELPLSGFSNEGFVLQWCCLGFGGPGIAHWENLLIRVGFSAIHFPLPSPVALGPPLTPHRSPVPNTTSGTISHPSTTCAKPCSHTREVLTLTHTMLRGRDAPNWHRDDERHSQPEQRRNRHPRRQRRLLRAR